MKALRFSSFGPVSGLEFIDLPEPQASPTMARIKVMAASINPSDVKNVQGKMEHTTLPRVPGRDFSGVVVEGPPDWIGAEVWGTGGEIGYSVDGSHAEQILVPIESLRRKPSNLTFAEAAVVGTTFLAAWISVVEYAQLRPGETLVVIGAGGGVGGSAVQIGKWRGARVIGVDRSELRSGASAAGSLDVFLVANNSKLVERVREATDGRGADVVFDTVGGEMFEPALGTLAHRGRLAEISSMGDRRVSFDLLDFYHNESQLVGADTRKRNAVQSALPLDALHPHFESGAFQAPRIDRVIPLWEGCGAYSQMAKGAARGRLVLAPDPSAAMGGVNV